jgi:ATP:ADP antiporter, AAA family
MNTNSEIKFGKIRSFLWPIYRSEYKKFIPMIVMFFLISFNYNLLRAIKDSLIVTANQSGAEALPFIKLWAILPMAFLMTYIFTKLSNHFSREKIFYIFIGIFLSFFVLFTLFLYPNRDLLHPYEFSNKLEQILPSGFYGLIAVIRNWTLTLFYVMSELWGVIMMSLLFWGFANEVTKVSEAKRFYSLFAIGANASGIISGQSAIKLSSTFYNPNLPFGETSWDQSVLYLNTTIVLTGIIIISIYRWFNKKVINPEFQIQESIKKEPKIKMSMRKNFAYLAKSKYLICIALIVLTYNVTINLVEVLWKNQLKELYPNPSDYSVYMGQVMTWMGLMATFIAIFVSGNVIRRFSWTLSALIPTIIMFSTGLVFFSFLVFKGSMLTPIAAFLGSTPLTLCVFFGALQNCLCRACKYTLFDATKELAFVPLKKECKLKGKAAIDGVGSRIGKCGGAFIYQTLLLTFGTLTSSSPYIFIIFLIVVGIWGISVISLGKQFKDLTSQDETLNIDDKLPNATSVQPQNQEATS